MENTKTTEKVSVELTTEQYAFLTEWQKTHEAELGMEIPVAALVRKAVDMAMKSMNKKEERPSRTGFSDRAPRDYGAPRGDRPSGRSFDKPGFKSGPRKPFGDRPSLGRGAPGRSAPGRGGPGRASGLRGTATRGGPKFSMMGPKNRTKTFDE